MIEILFKKVKTGYKNIKVSVTDFFTRQKTVLKNWLLNKDAMLGNLETEVLKRLQRFFDQIKSTLESLDSTKDMVRNTVNFLKAEHTVRIGHDPENPTESVTIRKDKLETVDETVKEFQDCTALDQGSKLNTVDALKWTIKNTSPLEWLIQHYQMMFLKQPTIELRCSDLLQREKPGPKYSLKRLYLRQNSPHQDTHGNCIPVKLSLLVWKLQTHC